jgi:hypothetical protein
MVLRACTLAPYPNVGVTFKLIVAHQGAPVMNSLGYPLKKKFVPFPASFSHLFFINFLTHSYIIL